jgi:hypothetical protein
MCLGLNQNEKYFFLHKKYYGQLFRLFDAS